MDPEPDDPTAGTPQMAPDVRLQRIAVGGGHASLEIGASVIAVVIVLSALKPWTWGEASAGAPLAIRAPIASVPGPSPTPDLTADGLAAPFCLGPYSWRTASLETWRTQPVRVWRAFEPRSVASRPADPQIPVIPIGAYAVPALGWCAPTVGVERPVGPIRLSVWQLSDDGGAVRFGVTRVAPRSGSSPLGALYRPGPEALAPAASDGWPDGRYVFQLDDIGTRSTYWFAVEIRILAPEPAAPTPQLP